MIFEKIKEVIANQLGVDEESITMETTFQEDLGADSLDLFQIVMDLEEEFNVKIENVDEIKSVSDAVKYIEERTE